MTIKGAGRLECYHLLLSKKCHSNLSAISELNARCECVFGPRLVKGRLDFSPPPACFWPIRASVPPWVQGIHPASQSHVYTSCYQSSATGAWMKLLDGGESEVGEFACWSKPLSVSLSLYLSLSLSTTLTTTSSISTLSQNHSFTPNH